MGGRPIEPLVTPSGRCPVKGERRKWIFISPRWGLEGDRDLIAYYVKKSCGRGNRMLGNAERGRGKPEVYSLEGKQGDWGGTPPEFGAER